MFGCILINIIRIERVVPSHNGIKAEEGIEMEEKQLAVLPISIYIVIWVLFPRNSDGVGLINSVLFILNILKLSSYHLQPK